MTRTDVMASSRPQTAAPKSRASRATRWLAVLPIVLTLGLALLAPGSAFAATETNSSGYGQEPNKPETGTSPRKKRRPRRPRLSETTPTTTTTPENRQNAALHGLRPAVELRCRPAPDGSRLLDRRRAAPPAPRRRALASATFVQQHAGRAAALTGRRLAAFKTACRRCARRVDCRPWLDAHASRLHRSCCCSC